MKDTTRLLHLTSNKFPMGEPQSPQQGKQEAMSPEMQEEVESTLMQ
jgi:hypothetical protein